MNSRRAALIDFGEFVKRQQTALADDWAKERDDWLRHLKALRPN
jgi:hypothetical protein